VANLAYDEAQVRLTGFYNWLISQAETKQIILNLTGKAEADKILSAANFNQPPRASTPEEVAAVGISFLKEITEGIDPVDLSDKYGVTPSYNTSSLQDHFNEVMRRYIDLTIDYVERELASTEDDRNAASALIREPGKGAWYPFEIEQSIGRFLKDHPSIDRNAFIMMKFGKTKTHELILQSIRTTLEKYGIVGLRSDDKEIS
jgi:hypothetical protein